MGNETLYIGDNIEIRVKDKIIDNIFVFIPSDLNIPHAFMIYKILTGCMPGEYAIADLYPYEILTKLEACYQCVEKIRRSDLYNPRICPSSIIVGCDKNGIRISVIYGEYDKRDRWQAMQAYSIGDKRIRDAVGKVYGYYAFARDSFGINVTEIYSSISSGQSKLFNHLCYVPDNSNEKLKKAEETIDKLKKRLNAIYGAPVCLKEFEKKYQETESAEELKKKIAAAYALPTFDDFDAITDELKDTYIKKNHDYGNSFDKSIDKFGLTAAVVRMNDKMERLNSLLNKDAKVDESIRDTVMDLANYCIMTAMYLDNKEKK